MKHWFTIVNFPTIYQPSILSTEITLRQFLKVCPASPDLDLRNSLRSELILMWFNLQMQTWFYKVSLRQLSKVCPTSPDSNLKKRLRLPDSTGWFFPYFLQHNQKPELPISLQKSMHQALQIFKNHGERVCESQKSFISVNKNLKYSTKVL
mgnify:CR=1 FL=1